MSLAIVIANIAGPVRQSPTAIAAAANASAPSAVAGVDAAAAAPGTANSNSTETVAASAPALAAAQPQLTSNFTVVVLQLLNEQGVVTATIPSAQQLAAYRAGTATPQS